MPQIKVLPKQIAELIAAGEVVERPSAVIKELVENSIDAGATAITVEIKRGGILYMSVTDNGSGIPSNDVPTAFMRHATSKISKQDDLDSIATLGFRGEALAAISAVSKTEIITRTAESEIGTYCAVEGGVQTALEEIGCNKGTVIVVKEIFYNTPARMKFLKSDVAEGNNIAAVIDRIALSHPEISFKLIRDSKQVLSTSGDGNLKNVIYAVLGRDFASSLIEVDTTIEGIRVSGAVCKPIYTKSNHNGQFFFLNGRLVQSKTMAAALINAYKNSIMTGKFPCCVLNVEMPYNSVDVNVHPSKTEVRFSDEKRVFNAVYYAAKSALETGNTRPEIKTTFNPYKPAEPEKYAQTKIVSEPLREEKKEFKYDFAPKNSEVNLKFSSNNYNVYEDAILPKEEKAEPPKPQVVEQKTDIPKTTQEDLPEVRYIGYAFDTYIIAESENEIYLIDKHAAHERILFEQLKKREEMQIQELIIPESVVLTKEEYAVLLENAEQILELGFEIEDFGNGSLLVRSVPSILTDCSVSDMLSEIATNLLGGGKAFVEKIDDIYHSIACKAAIKGGRHTTDLELKVLAERILSDKDIMYCPHGRPVAFKLTRRELEKHFGRIQ